ncbi:MAG TPA: DUF2520 domain-containing protein, partial [Planctomycetota bacterium]|nr:DUF2520 domain-containing protein [Planctomycetota bacterium]
KRSAALGPLATLAEGTLANIRAVGIPKALTGPIERGEIETLRRHVAAILEWAPALWGPYASLGGLTVEVAAAKGSLGRAAAGKIRSALLAERRR